MQTYRRFASTASSTSRSASSSMHTHTHAHAHQPYTHSTLSRSSSTASAVSPSAMTPVDNNGNVNVNVNKLNNSFSRISSMSSIRNSSYVSPSSSSTSDYTRAELETIAESLLAHVHFGPYHLASSPVPSSHLRLAMTSNTNATSTSTKENNLNDPPLTPTLGQLGRYAGPSSRRHFEGKEGGERGNYNNNNNNHHPRARFTIGESERGRGITRKSVGLSMRDVNNDYDYERGRAGTRAENRGRSGNVKVLQAGA